MIVVAVWLVFNLGLLVFLCIMAEFRGGEVKEEVLAAWISRTADGTYLYDVTEVGGDTPQSERFASRCVETDSEETVFEGKGESPQAAFEDALRDAARRAQERSS